MKRFVNIFCFVIAVAGLASRSAQAARPWLHELPESEQAELSALILSYLTEEEIHWHMNIDHADPQSFFHGHRAYIQRLESYLQRQGAGRFVPLPKWDPALPIPGSFRLVTVNYQDLQNFEIGMPVPIAFRGQSLRQFDSMPSLFEAISPWHDEVHVRVGGCMGDLMTAPAAPIFFCWHACVDDLFDEWAFYSGYQIPVSFENEFPDHVDHGDHLDHGSHDVEHGPVGGAPHDHGCVCGPNCRCGPNCQCPRRAPEPVAEPEPPRCPHCQREIPVPHVPPYVPDYVPEFLPDGYGAPIPDYYHPPRRRSGCSSQGQPSSGYGQGGYDIGY